MAVIKDVDFAKALVPQIYEHYMLGEGMGSNMRAMLFNMLTTDRAWEEHVGVGGVDPTPFLSAARHRPHRYAGFQRRVCRAV